MEVSDNDLSDGNEWGSDDGGDMDVDLIDELVDEGLRQAQEDKDRVEAIWSEYSLSDEQRMIAQYFYDRKSDGFISGPAGCGKSRITSAICAAVGVDACVVVAPTGVAAHNIEVGEGKRGVTINRFCGRKYDRLEVSYDKWFQESLEGITHIFIDEVSMINHEQMDFFVHMLDLHGCKATLILSGDVLQRMPCGKEAPFFKSRYIEDGFIENRPGGGMYGRRLVSFYLTKSFRQKDDLEFANILARMSRGWPEDPEQAIKDLRIINTRVISKLSKEEQREFDAERLITFSRAGVNRHNQEKLREMEGGETVYWTKCIMKFYVDGKLRMEHAPSSKMEYAWSRAKGAEREQSECLKFKVGSRVSMTKNVDVQKGLCNGTPGVVEELDSDSVTVKFDSIDEPVVVKPYEMCVDMGRGSSKDGVRYYLSQIPLKLAHASTVDSCQSLSLDRMKYNHEESKATMSGTTAMGLVYVALSRVKELSGLVLTKPIQPKNVIVSPDCLDFDTLLRDKSRLQETD